MSFFHQMTKCSYNDYSSEMYTLSEMSLSECDQITTHLLLCVLCFRPHAKCYLYITLHDIHKTLMN